MTQPNPSPNHWSLDKKLHSKPDSSLHLVPQTKNQWMHLYYWNRRKEPVRICVCPTSPSCWAVIVYKCGLGTLSLRASFWGWVLPKPVCHGIRAPRFVVWRRCWVWTPAHLVGTLGVRAGVRICVCPTSPSGWAVIVYKCGLGTLSLWASFWGWVLPKPVCQLPHIQINRFNKFHYSSICNWYEA